MNEWQVILLKPARRYLERLASEEQRRILDALALLQKDPFQLDMKPLKGREEWRYRIGQYRALMMVDRDQKRLIVTRIGARGDIYK